jgi:tungstate transport system ATP-binding protein
MMPAAVELRDLRVVRGARTVLSIDTMTVGRGELAAVVGPNGSGKSTLLRVLDGLLPAERGDAIVLGEKIDPGAALRIRRRCALVFQDPLLLRGTVFDNVALAPRFRGWPRGRVHEQVERAMRSFRCEHLTARPAHRLSGGEARRVCLARALVCDPELVMLDEPFVALDSPTRSALVQELRDVAMARGTTVLLVTHDFDDVLRFADRAFVLLDGAIVQDAPPGRVQRAPVNADVARLVSMDNIVACETEPTEGGMRIGLPGGVQLTIPGKHLSGVRTCCFPGDGVTLEPSSSQPCRADRVRGQVVRVEPAAGLHRITVDCGASRLVARVARDRAEELRAGQSIDVAIDPASVHLV